MGKVRAMRVPDFIKNGKDAFIRKFINKPLEPLSEEIYCLLVKMYKEKYGFFVLSPSFIGLYDELQKFIYIVEAVDDLYDDDYLKDLYKCKDVSWIEGIRKNVIPALIDGISKVTFAADKIVFSSIERKDLEPAVQKWQTLLNTLPSVHTVEYDDKGLLTRQYLEEIEDAFILFAKETLRLIEQANDIYAAEIVSLVKQSDLIPSNALYRDIYDCLKIANLIPPQQLHMHDTSTSKYVRENYIKAKYSRL